MNKTLKRVFASILVLSMMISTVFATPILTTSEMDMDITVEDHWTVFVETEYNYTDAHIDQINGEMAHYYTLDMTAVDISGSTSIPIQMGWNGNYYTTFPDPYPDGDDDDNNGFEEECEITIRGDLQKGRTYIFTVTFDKFSAVTEGIIQLNEQLSALSLLPGDKYNTAYGTSHTIHYQAWAESNSRHAAARTGSDRDSLPLSASETNIVLNESVSSKAELDALVARKNQEYNNWKASSAARSIANSEKVTAVLTFEEAISMDELTDLLSSSNADLVCYQAKFINEDGDWCTYGGNSIDEDDMVDTANMIAERNGIPHTSYEGIVCAEVSFETDSPAYELLNNSEYVYFVDMSHVTSASEDEAAILGSYAWKLAEFKETQHE